jgi:hypothetical protein
LGGGEPRSQQSGSTSGKGDAASLNALMTLKRDRPGDGLSRLVSAAQRGRSTIGAMRGWAEMGQGPADVAEHGALPDRRKQVDEPVPEGARKPLAMKGLDVDTETAGACPHCFFGRFCLDAGTSRGDCLTNEFL